MEEKDLQRPTEGKDGSSTETNNRFARFNTKSKVVKYTSSREYNNAKLDQLASSSSWSKEETDVLLSLCEQFNLCFNVIVDQFLLTDLPNNVLKKRARHMFESV